MNRNPVLLELFTSEGCSSCPPADDLLRKLIGRDDVVPLSFHVDYWDSIGWPDPFASKRWTERQYAYAQAFKARNVYTPQAVINGRSECVGSDRRRVDGYIEQERSRAEENPSPRVHEVRLDPAGFEVVFEADDAPAPGKVQVAFVQDGHVVVVKRGENAGRTLRHDHVVRALASAKANGDGLLHARIDMRDEALRKEIRPGLVTFIQGEDLAVHGVRYDSFDSLNVR